MQTRDPFAVRLDARVAEAWDGRLVDRVSAGRTTRLARTAAYGLVTPVHLVGVALLAAGLALLVLGDGWWQRLMAAFVLGIAWLTRPDLGAPADPDSTVVAAEQAPALTGLVAQVAHLLGTRPPDEIRVDSSVNAAVGWSGLSRRRLVIGAPLWVALTPQARLALVGHELGHLAHGDLLDLRYVASGYRTLHHWVALLDPDSSEVFLHDTPLLVRAVLAPPRWLVLGYLHLLDRMNAAAGRQQELYADLAAALVAGTPAAVDCLEVMLAADLVDAAANRAAVDGARPHLGASIAERMRRYDTAQRAAERRRGATDRRRTDASHPPTVDRLRLLESVEASSAAVVLDQARSDRIDEELAPVLDQAFARMAEAYRYVA